MLKVKTNAMQSVNILNALFNEFVFVFLYWSNKRLFYLTEVYIQLYMYLSSYCVTKLNKVA